MVPWPRWRVLISAPTILDLIWILSRLLQSRSKTAQIKHIDISHNNIDSNELNHRRAFKEHQSIVELNISQIISARKTRTLGQWLVWCYCALRVFASWTLWENWYSVAKAIPKQGFYANISDRDVALSNKGLWVWRYNYWRLISRKDAHMLQCF